MLMALLCELYRLSMRGCQRHGVIKLVYLHQGQTLKDNIHTHQRLRAMSRGVRSSNKHLPALITAKHPITLHGAITDPCLCWDAC